MPEKSSSASMRPKFKIENTIAVSVPRGKLFLRIREIKYLFELCEVDTETITEGFESSIELSNFSQSDCVDRLLRFFRGELERGFGMALSSEMIAPMIILNYEFKFYGPA